MRHLTTICLVLGALITLVTHDATAFVLLIFLALSPYVCDELNKWATRRQDKRWKEWIDKLTKDE